jgi:hypothetical protein
VDYGRAFVIGSGMALRETASRIDSIGGSVIYIGSNVGEPGAVVRRAKLIGAAEEIRLSIPALQKLMEQMDEAARFLDQMAQATLGCEPKASAE